MKTLVREHVRPRVRPHVRRGGSESERLRKLVNTACINRRWRGLATCCYVHGTLARPWFDRGYTLMCRWQIPSSNLLQIYLESGQSQGVVAISGVAAQVGGSLNTPRALIHSSLLRLVHSHALRSRPYTHPPMQLLRRSRMMQLLLYHRVLGQDRHTLLSSLCSTWLGGGDGSLGGVGAVITQPRCRNGSTLSVLPPPFLP